MDRNRFQILSGSPIARSSWRRSSLGLPPPRVTAPPALSALCSADATDRAGHAHGKAFRDVVRNLAGDVHQAGGTLKEAFERTHAALAPQFGAWPIFEHCLPFNVQRLWDEYDGIERPRIWTAERDREVWDALQE